MVFKVFDAYGAASRPEATLRASGYLFLSKGIMKRACVENATHAQLMFDEESDVLGIRLYEAQEAPDDGSSREVSPEKSGISVNVTPLLRYYDLPEPKNIGKQVFSVTFQDNVIVINLKEYRNAKPQTADASATKSPAESFDDDIPF